MTRRRFILCRASFSDDYVARIRAAVPENWYVTETFLEADAARTGSTTLFIMGGSKTNQKEQTVRVRFCGGATPGPFTVKLATIAAFFAGFDVAERL